MELIKQHSTLRIQPLWTWLNKEIGADSCNDRSFDFSPLRETLPKSLFNVKTGLISFH